MTSISAGHIILTPTQALKRGGGGQRGNRTHDLLTRGGGRVLYRPSYRHAPRIIEKGRNKEERMSDLARERERESCFFFIISKQLNNS